MQDDRILDSGLTRAEAFALLEPSRRPSPTLVDGYYTPFRYVLTLLVVAIVVTAGSAFWVAAARLVPLPWQHAANW